MIIANCFFIFNCDVTDEIQKKFGGAKAISSKDVFGDQGQVRELLTRQ